MKLIKSSKRTVAALGLRAAAVGTATTAAILPAVVHAQATTGVAALQGADSTSQIGPAQVFLIGGLIALVGWAFLRKVLGK